MNSLTVTNLCITCTQTHHPWSSLPGVFPASGLETVGSSIKTQLSWHFFQEAFPEIPRGTWLSRPDWASFPPGSELPRDGLTFLILPPVSVTEPGTQYQPLSHVYLNVIWTNTFSMGRKQDSIPGTPVSRLIILLHMWKVTTGHIPWENHNSKRVMYQNVHCSSIYNSQDMEAT